MKKILISNYSLNSDINILKKNDYYYFVYSNKKYYFSEYNRSEEEFNDLFELNNELINKNIATGVFILNKDNNYITKYDDKKYVLIEMPLSSDNEYNVLDMVDYAKLLPIEKENSLLYRNNWSELWSSKVDYFEYQVSQLGKDKKIILNSFDYYVGLAENAISYVNNTIKNYKRSDYEKITLQRKRIFYPNLHYEYFNPLNYIVDIEVRDVASYFKSLFFNSYEDLWIEVNSYFKRNKLSMFGYQLLYSRLLFPSFYFDIYEDVMENNKDEEVLMKYIEKASDYEDFLKDMYQIISKYAPIDKIDWIVNKKEL